MKNSVPVGIALGALFIFGSFLLEGGSAGSLFLIPPLVIVIGGTLAATAIGASFQEILKMPAYFGVAMRAAPLPTIDLISFLVRMASLARRDGVLAIERRMDEVPHPFLRKLFRLAIDGADPETLRAAAETEIGYMEQRHRRVAQLFTKAGGYSPTMGIIGTVMGLISTLASAGNNPNELIHHIASAFIATLWGIFMANIIWLPVADKLKALHEEEVASLELMIDGVTAIQSGENPSVIRSQLVGALPISEQEEAIASISLTAV